MSLIVSSIQVITHLANPACQPPSDTPGSKFHQFHKNVRLWRTLFCKRKQFPGSTLLAESAQMARPHKSPPGKVTHFRSITLDSRLQRASIQPRKKPCLVEKIRIPVPARNPIVAIVITLTGNRSVAENQPGFQRPHSCLNIPILRALLRPWSGCIRDTSSI